MPDVNLITLTDPRAPAAEAYRTLRTNLMFYSLDNPLKTLVITSPAADDGKSMALANLAVTLAQGDHKTIVVDCDLRKPVQHDVWNLANERGLTDMMLDDAALQNPPFQDVGIDNLVVLTSGALPPNPADVIGSRRMDDVLAVLCEQAEYVLFDVPPVLAVTDAALLGLKADGMLLVLRAGKSRRDHAARAKEELERVKAPLIGAVLVNALYDSVVSYYYAR
ncbi:MAG: CpsD/CapB family tyrosine-protein kinase [Anaerolineae bacterium]|nr:CpsD/CapB family tyrosine-protein kinase [Anaerolineae bacterium]